ncbi:MAG: chemotaxis response regulator protein-glutamate methylesterase [Planctomycetota bacterium]|nr:chemotaxis response regulator protein-glutamate methylesterase [Planctomycetota bacterium]
MAEASPRAFGNRTRVLVVDDSALVRELLSQMLSADPEIEVVGTARDANRAWQRIQSLKPDVITLDVEMPGMDGLTFLERLMRIRPMPVIMVSSLTEKGSSATMRALELGAIDFVCKPKVDVKAGTAALADEIVSKVKVASRARLPVAPARPIARATADGFPRVGQACVALGASTGGPKALGGLLQALPSDFPPILVTQHMPGTFTRSFADRLDGQCDLTVREAEGGEAPRRGMVFIAPGIAHLRVELSALGPVLVLDDGPPVNHHRPSVDVLFDSVAEVYGRHGVAALLTGMGADGARGLGAIRAAGGSTIAQDEKTSLVYGMPRVAFEIGAAEHVLPLERIPRALVKLVAKSAARRRRA